MSGIARADKSRPIATYITSNTVMREISPLARPAPGATLESCWSMIKEQRDRALSQQGPGHRAEQEFAEDRLTVGTHDDQHGVVLTGRLQDRLRRRIIGCDGMS